MIYFSKIEAYFAGALNEEERLVFEQELAENEVLQKEFTAYETAQSIFGFTAENLSERDIITTTATETADGLIKFTAKNLSEEEILQIGTPVVKETIVRKLQPRRNRAAWLVAASMLMILSVIGMRFHNNQDSWKTLGQDSSAVVATEKTNKVPTIESPTPPVLPVIKEEIAPSNIVAKKPSKKITTPKYDKAKVRITKKVIPTDFQNVTTAETSNQLADFTSKNSKPKLLALNTTLNTTAQEITTRTTISEGQSVVYQAEKVITLKEGFHAKAGANFTAAPLSKNIVTDFASDATIEGQQVTFEATNSVILQPGFHAKAGTEFVAKTAPHSLKDFSTNTTISDKESVVVETGNTITLQPGFHAKAGADFVAKIKQ